MLHHFVNIVKNVQLVQRIEFYKEAIDKGLLKMIQFSIKNDIEYVENRLLTTEIIMSIVEQDVSLFQSDTMDAQFDSTILQMLIDILINDQNIGLKTQAFEALKIILNPTNLICEDDTPRISDELDDKDRIDESFYQNLYASNGEPLAGRLFLPLKSQPEVWHKHNVVCYTNLCELLSYMAEQHLKVHSRSFILENDLLTGVSDLMHPNVQSLRLRLNALRCIKRIIALNDELYTRYIISHDILANFMTLLEECNLQNNLVNSCCLNLLSDILTQQSENNYRLLRSYLVGNYRSQLMKNSLGKILVIGDDNSLDGPGDSDDSGDNDDEESCSEYENIKTDLDFDE